MKKTSKCYLVTIKGHEHRHYSREELDGEWERLRSGLKKTEWSDLRAYEEDSVGRLHLHIYCRADRRPYFARFQKKGWSIHFKEFPPSDIVRVYDYLNKHNQRPDVVDQLFVFNRSKFEYLFI